MSLFEKIVETSRLSPMLAPYTVTRLLVRAGIDPKNVTPEGLRKALPEFERGLVVYLGADETERAVADLRALVR